MSVHYLNYIFVNILSSEFSDYRLDKFTPIFYYPNNYNIT